MAVILFFGRFSDLSTRMDISLPPSVTDKVSLNAFLSKEIEGFAALVSRPDTRIAVNKMVSLNPVAVTDADEIAYMSALSGG